MKNLPATIGLMIVLFVFFLFQGNLNRTVQANPVNQDELVQQDELVKQTGYQELFQDTFPPKMRDTINPARKAKKEKREMKKEMKKHQKDSSGKKDMIM
ncbi:hypothetical protein [Chitinophaga varians]|uniref:hypothetical protein n=1 Tax=Chitinophaga varians TaxID=2202339 RepID=UPI00165EFE5B|nr:hypothetical protein [Chitinophaga varians]MBC9914744.1 hypothetical protein [Chitinophaga varians]